MDALGRRRTGWIAIAVAALGAVVGVYVDGSWVSAAPLVVDVDEILAARELPVSDLVGTGTSDLTGATLDHREPDHGGVGGTRWFVFEPPRSGRLVLEADPGFVVAAYAYYSTESRLVSGDRNAGNAVYEPYARLTPLVADWSPGGSGEPVAIAVDTPGTEQVFVAFQRADETAPMQLEFSWDFTPTDPGRGDGIGADRTRTGAHFLGRGGWWLRDGPSGGLTDTRTPGLRDCDLGHQCAQAPIPGDWDGNGIDSAGFADLPRFRLSNAAPSASSSVAATARFRADLAFDYGRRGDTPLVGDWNGDGTDTVGIRRGNVFHLRNSNTAGPADIVLAYGRSSDVPVVGDWDGDGVDTVGVRRGTVWYLRNVNTTGVGEVVFGYGYVDDDALAGDWDGDGVDTVGVHRGRLWLLRNSNSEGPPDAVFGYGVDGDIPLVGNWDGR